LYRDPHDPKGRLRLIYGDLTDSSSLNHMLKTIRPDEIYNLGAQSHVRVSFDVPVYTADVTALGTARLLEAIRESSLTPRFYQASSSEMFGNAPAPQNEATPFQPVSPYACAKLYAHGMVQNARQAYGLFACNGILFNHESPRRGETFVTRKVTRSVARIKLGLDEHLFLGNLEARRDWGYAKEYVEAMWLMLQQDQPDDFVIATGETHSVEEFVVEAFSHAGLDWKKHVKTDSRYLRPIEVECLRGDAAKAKRMLNWAPKVKFRDLVRLMVDADVKDLEAHLSGHAVRTKRYAPE
jgi:GDPmannose 4,6-dehydratase